MYEYDEECLKVFLKKQLQLFDEPVAESIDEAEAFLEDCMAVVVKSLKEVREYFEENGTDISDMSDEELEYWAWLCKYDSINQTLSLRQFSKDGDVTNAYKCYIIR
jgi:hypothetical protein